MWPEWGAVSWTLRAGCQLSGPGPQMWTLELRKAECLINSLPPQVWPEAERCCWPTASLDWSDPADGTFPVVMTPSPLTPCLWKPCPQPDTWVCPGGHSAQGGLGLKGRRQWDPGAQLLRSLLHLGLCWGLRLRTNHCADSP